MDYEKVLGERLIPTYEELKSGLLRLIDEGKISREDASRVLPELRESEDEQIVDWLYDMLKRGIDGAPKGCPDNPIAEKALAWLEKQKEQKPDTEICPHSIKSKSYSITGYPCEWSEEDDKIRRNLMSLLVNMRGDRITEETYQKYYPWLKSLRPGWKPTDKQMKALQSAKFIYKDGLDNSAVASILESLYNDLKKL